MGLSNTFSGLAFDQSIITVHLTGPMRTLEIWRSRVATNQNQVSPLYTDPEQSERSYHLYSWMNHPFLPVIKKKKKILVP